MVSDNCVINVCHLFSHTLHHRGCTLRSALLCSALQIVFSVSSELFAWMRAFLIFLSLL